MMSVKYCIIGSLNLHLLNLKFYYFLIFFGSFGILFYRSLRDNGGFYVKNAQAEILAKCLKRK
jgi:hypothetical protein